MLKYYGLEARMDEVRTWYNGYCFGQAQVYNPWSIINFAKHRELKPYWVSTSSDTLIKDLLRVHVEYVKEGLEKLLLGEGIETDINENLNYDVLKTSKENIWSLFLLSGYLNIVKRRDIVTQTLAGEKRRTVFLLKIPNSEVLNLYSNIIVHWFSESVGSSKVEALLRELTRGEMETFEEMFADIVEEYFSYYDIDELKGEEFYHAFNLGLLINHAGTYRVESNRESGYGRSDILLIPEDKNKRGIVLEFKVKKKAESNLEETAQAALRQIQNKNYRAELEKSGVQEIFEIGIGFKGKEVKMIWN